MKITRNTAEHLILDHIPWRSAILNAGFLFAIVAMGIIQREELNSGNVFWILVFLGFAGYNVYRITRRVQLILSRSNGTATLRRRTFLEYTENSFPLDEVTAAVLEEKPMHKGRIATRPSLQLSNHPDPIHPIVMTYDSTYRDAHKHAVDTINRWLATDRQTRRPADSVAP